MTKHHHTYLALGDSYTIGESVALHESFPYQIVQILRKAGFHFHAPEIVAKTGWTTFELAEHLLHQQLNAHYDFVTLLIGVNNQYRGLPIDAFEEDFIFLLNKALYFSNQQPEKVVVLSIPDWGCTPFAKEKDSEEISKAINAFNEIIEKHCQTKKTHLINITQHSREVKLHPELLAKDELHYSGTAHLCWAEKVAALFKDQIK